MRPILLLSTRNIQYSILAENSFDSKILRSVLVNLQYVCGLDWVTIAWFAMPILAQIGMVLAANLNFTSSRQASIINEQPYLYQNKLCLY